MYRPFWSQEGPWMGLLVEQLADLFRITHQVKTQQVDRSRRKRCGDIELAGYLRMLQACALVPRPAHRPWALGEWRVAVGEWRVALTLFLTVICITLMTYIGHSMKRLLTRYVTTVLIIITVPLTLFLSCLLLLAPLAASTASLCACFFCRLMMSRENQNAKQAYSGGCQRCLL
jgi:hypothetical protein